MDTKVSIIMPVYNSEKYLEETINSIIVQSFKNYELIIVDDGSTDASLEIINAYAQGDKRILAFTQQNSGPAAARNYGMTKANGEYVIFFDSDDIMMEDALLSTVNAIEMMGVDLVIGSYLFWMVDFNKIVEMKGTSFRLMKSSYEEVSLFQPFPMNKMYRSSLIKEHRIEFSDTWRGEDLNFYLKYVLFTDRIHVIEHPILKYRWNENGLSRTPSADKLLSIVASFQDVKAYYQRHRKQELYDDYLYSLELIHYNYALKCLMKIDHKEERYKLVLGIRDHLGKRQYYKLDKFGKSLDRTCRKIIRNRWMYCTNWYCNLVRAMQARMKKENSKLSEE